MIQIKNYSNLEAINKKQFPQDCLIYLLALVRI